MTGRSCPSGEMTNGGRLAAQPPGMKEEWPVCMVYRDTDVRLSAGECGLWLCRPGEARFLPLKDCVSSARGREEVSPRCVGARDITRLTMTLDAAPAVRIVFVKGIRAFVRTGRTAARRFLQLQRELNALGYTTYDLS